MANFLSRESSPYLLQHAENPVNWYPWGDEAFEQAKKENKPVLLSIGYSTCHWCHVMAHESFENAEVARLMNETFVSVKVDREERPDIDKVYMTVCQMMTGTGGWPLTVIMTPDKQPFFAATYIPKENKYGRMGLVELIPHIAKLWSERNNDVLLSASQITSSLQQTGHEAAAGELTESVLHLAYAQLAERFDEQNGGFGQAPKFPTPHNMIFLLRYWKRTGNGKALFMVERTLQGMRKGGIYDHIGFGFHRYATDSNWLVPHFEKMLYDQALLANAYTEAYQATKKEEYAETARAIITYVLRDMTAPEGGFYTAEDADSEGHEGKFYLWTADEMGKVLSPEEVTMANKVFNINETGNFIDEITGINDGKNVLFLTKPLTEIAAEVDISLPQLIDELAAIRAKLYENREQRVHPHKDTKILTDWNGLMIAALAKAARVFDEPEFLAAAIKATHFILEKLQAPGGRLSHAFRPDAPVLTGNADDYAFLIYGLMELYETTFDVRYLTAAIKLNESFIRHFWDREQGGFYFTADDGETLLIRQRDIYDGAIPSANSMAMLNLTRLGRITANPDFEDKAGKIGQAFHHEISLAPSAHCQSLVALDYILGPSFEVVIVGDQNREETRKMIDAVRGRFIPNKIVILRPSNQMSPEMDTLAAFVKDHRTIDDKPTAYICRNYVCELPTTDIDRMLTLLDDRK